MSAFNEESFYKSGKEMQNKVLIMEKRKSKANPNYKVWELFTSNVSFFFPSPFLDEEGLSKIGWFS